MQLSNTICDCMCDVTCVCVWRCSCQLTPNKCHDMHHCVRFHTTQNSIYSTVSVWHHWWGECQAQLSNLAVNTVCNCCSHINHIYIMWATGEQFLFVVAANHNERSKVEMNISHITFSRELVACNCKHESTHICKLARWWHMINIDMAKTISYHCTWRVYTSAGSTGNSWDLLSSVCYFILHIRVCVSSNVCVWV